MKDRLNSNKPGLASKFSKIKEPVCQIDDFRSFETLLHLLKGSLGTGILAMPRAFYHAGYGVGTVATIIIGLFCTYCMRILVSSEYELCKRKRVASLSYPATAEAALAVGPTPFRRFSRASVWVVFNRHNTSCKYSLGYFWNIPWRGIESKKEIDTFWDTKFNDLARDSKFFHLLLTC